MPYLHQTGDITPGTTPAGTAYEIFNAHPTGTVSNVYLCRFIVPTARSTSSKYPVVFFFHGTGGTLVNDVADAADLWKGWIDQGWIVASPTAAGVSWGNAAARTGIAAAWAYILDVFDGPDQGALLYGQSMGGMVGLHLILGDTIPVVAWAGNSPATNLADAYAEPGLDSGIRDAYNIAGDGSNYAAQTATSGGGGGNADPQLRDAADFLANCLWYRFYASAGDNTISKAQNSDLLTTKLAAATEETVVVCTGGHVSADHFRHADTLAFYQRALAALDVPTKRPRIAARAFAGLA